MRVQCGPSWTELYLRSELGQHADDPPEAQRTFAALVEREHHESSWIVGGVNVIQVDLDDIDTAARLLAQNPPEWADRYVRLQLRRNADKFQRRGATMKRQLLAFRGVVGRSHPPCAYRAFKGRRSGPDDSWPYYPLRSLCPKEVLGEGVLWPVQINRPRRMRYYTYYTFIPIDEFDPATPRMAAGDALSTRPRSRVAELVR